MRELSKFVFGDTKFKLILPYSLHFELPNADNIVDSKKKKHVVLINLKKLISILITGQNSFNFSLLDTQPCFISKVKQHY